MQTETFSSIIQPEIKAAGVPGCSYVVVNRDGILAAGGARLADIRQGRAASAETVYHLFSATKLYTATAIMQLVESGQLDLDTPFVEILPETSHPGLGSITIRHLLTHTSGLSDTLKAAVTVRRAGESAPEADEVLKRYQLKSIRPAGKKVEYANVGYAILGAVIARVSGQSYSAAIEKNILCPLGMNATFTHTTMQLTASATAYLGTWDPMRLLVGLLLPEIKWVLGERVGGFVALQPYDLDSAAIGGLVGSPLDFAPFLIANLNNGRGLVQAKTCQQMQSLQARGQAGYEARMGMGLGWKIGTDFINHEGSGAGYATETRLYPSKNLGILLMMNLSSAKAHKAAHRICESIAQTF
jgi:CubicO group peptidase (beta-lactamase class C family)